VALFSAASAWQGQEDLLVTSAMSNLQLKIGLNVLGYTFNYFATVLGEIPNVNEENETEIEQTR
jgi:hypothetical protein